MPAPRAARLAQRKSVVPDPDLYGNDSDSADSDAPPRASKPAPAKPTTQRKSKANQPVRGSVTTDGGRRRSTRISNESQESVQAAQLARPDKQSARAPHPDEGAAPARTKAAVSKGKKRAAKERESSADEEGDVEDEVVRVGAAGKASKPRASTKRPRMDEDEGQDEAEAELAAPAASGSQAKAPAPWRGFVPRAAANPSGRSSKPPPEYSTLLVDSSADDPSPFPFTTNPPTPYAGPTKRAAAKPKANPRAKVPRTAHPPTNSDEITPDDTHPPVASGSRSRLTPPRQPPGDQPGSYPPHETPVQVKNIAFRQGPGTPATGSRTARRSSAKGSRNRGSSIGGGYEAVPHPQVADDKLYRSTDADDPLAKRMRSIVSWAAQRTRDRVFRTVPNERDMDNVQRAAKDVMDEFIADVCNLKVDTSVPYKEPSQSQDPNQLPPHPQNESNALKMKELEASYAAIAHEQEVRQILDETYQTFFDRRAASHSSYSSDTFYTSLSPPSLPDASSPPAYAASLDLSKPAPMTLEEALELGRSLIRGEGVKPDAVAGGKKKGKGKEKAQEDMPSEGLDRRILDAQIATKHLHHLTHMLSSFSLVALKYISHRSSETYTALSLQAQQGAGVLDAPRSGGEAKSAPGSGGAGEAEGGTGLAGALAAVGAGAPEGGALDMRDLLRALSRADAPVR
ncbi:hypothetical protein JCM8547_007051 [Rhodosporidiobolus lusitaniae]